MDPVALSTEEQAYFETGGENTPSSVSDVSTAPENITDQPVVDTGAQPDTVDQPRDEKGKFVPHQALHAEREEHKKTRSELTQMRERQAVLEDRWNTLLKLREEKQEEPNGPPDPNEDIFGHIKWQSEQIANFQKQAEERSRSEQEARQASEQENAVNAFWQSSVQEYAASQPEFSDAANWLSEYRHKQLSALSALDPNMANPAARNQQIDMELRQIIAVAKQQGKNPAQLVHDLAKQWGFTPQAPDPESLKMPDNLARIDQAQQASRTLTSTGGKNGNDPLTAEAIASMSADEFARWSSDPANERRLARLLGA